MGEEELQLQLALAMSKEEHDEEERRRRGDDVKLQLAIEESKKETDDGVGFYQRGDLVFHIAGYPLHRENRENGQKNPCQGIHRELGNFAKTQGIWFTQLVNSLIVKIKDISKFAAKISPKKIES